MQTRRDHLHAYQFAVDRLATSLTTGDASRGENPTRRSAFGTLFGTGVVILLCIGFSVYGLIAPVPDHSWRTPGSYIVEKETGNRYLLIGGELRPVRNYSSVLLYSRGAVAHSVSRADLNGITHGSEIGIPGAPDQVPTPDRVLGGSWTRCLRPGLAHGQSVGFGTAATGSLSVAFPSDRQVLLESGDGDRYLLWRGKKYPVPGLPALMALGLDGDRPLAAPDDWLTAVPTGPALSAVLPAGRGEPAGRVAGRPVAVGQLFSTTTAGERHFYVMTRQGVARTNATEYSLLAADKASPEPRSVSPSALAAARVSADDALLTALPDVAGAPALPAGDHAVCLAQRVAGSSLRTDVVVAGGAVADGDLTAVVPTGHGLVVRSREAVLHKVPDPKTYLITDDGTAYQLATDDVTAALGLSGLVSVLPDQVIALLPRGPVLAMPAPDEGKGGTSRA
ncbi:type VII secretion protein EccB [Actinacidiphila alni]|uniref:Type VII secretion protein EccB n=1 Tax=Actinacidiphila alni TaxID=380248 RepID=A0A1I2E8B1_9ACTN|nr:type VII secretion protein EccB [Actinacidiphila alni]SFE89065.1 type VII secretion protein EccB [Actinacidiphila alni]